MNHRTSTVFALVASVSFMIGCGSSQGTKPEGSVSGVVTVGGQPLPNVNVNFQDPKTGSAAIATTDSAGKFRFEGPVVAGSFKVYFTPVVAMPSAPDSPPPVIVPLTIQEKYTSIQTTDLVKEVKPGSNTIPLEIN